MKQTFTFDMIEIDTIVAALRSYLLDWEVLGGFENLDAQIRDLATGEEQHDPLSRDETDALCTRLAVLAQVDR